MQKNIEAILKVMRQTAGNRAVISSKSPFQVLVSTILSQRTRDENTAKAAKQLFEKYPTAAYIVNAPLAELRKLIKPAGFFKVKAARIKEVSRQTIERFHGRVPSDLGLLLSLPGVGRKTANCVLVYGFGKPAMPVDVHVHRISNRTGLVKTKSPKETEKELIKNIPKKYWFEFNHLFVRHGQTICLPRKPKCTQCRIIPWCNYFQQSLMKADVIKA